MENYEMYKKMYKMKLHDCISTTPDHSGLFYITRVPGGWIYERRHNSIIISSTFVPWDNEFQTNGGNEK